MSRNPDAAAQASKTDAISFGVHRAVVTRRCDVCITRGVVSPRTIGEPCGTCGNTAPAETADLGPVSAEYRNPIKQAWWNAVRAPLANRRIRKAGARTLELRTNRGD